MGPTLGAAFGSTRSINTTLDNLGAASSNLVNLVAKAVPRSRPDGFRDETEPARAPYAFDWFVGFLALNPRQAGIFGQASSDLTIAASIFACGRLVPRYRLAQLIISSVGF